MDEIVQSLREMKFEKRVGDVRPGGNDPCPCCSGKKFKKCHGR